jgi:hypothetical protein
MSEFEADGDATLAKGVAVKGIDKQTFSATSASLPTKMTTIHPSAARDGEGADKLR